MSVFITYSLKASLQFNSPEEAHVFENMMNELLSKFKENILELDREVMGC